MKLLKAKIIKKKLKPMLSAIKQIGSFVRHNCLALLNLILTCKLLLDVAVIQQRLDVIQGALGKIYIDVLQAIGFDAMLLMGLIQKLLGGESA